MANTTIAKFPSSLFEELINEKQLNLYEYEQFNEIEEISIKEERNKIYKADWKLKNVVVTLKELMIDVTSQENRSILHSFIDELKLRQKLDFHSNILKFYGITKGKIKISIFGSSLISDIKGDTTYIDPQGYENNNKKLDIYSLGFLLWEISCGKIPSRTLYLPSNNNSSSSPSLSSSITQESSAKGTPQSYIDLYKNCWNDDPDKRPDINEVKKILGQINVTSKIRDGIKSSSSNSTNQKKSIKLENQKSIKKKTTPPNINIIKSSDKRNTDTDSTFFGNLLKFFIELLELSGDNDYIITSLKGFLHNHMREHKSTFKSLLKNYSDDSNFNFIIGFFYENSIGTVQDKQLAFNHYEKSAKTGNSIGQYFLGRCYYWGIGIKIDRKKAYEWLKKSADNDNFKGKWLLGLCYERGYGTTKDLQKAFELFLSSAENGNVVSQMELGRCYEEGVGTKKNINQAIECYQQASKSVNNSLAQKKLNNLKKILENKKKILDQKKI
ncbi:9867_t:CDS:2 [Entrophospora sp. SA101]|nr:11207_t:CDS:2 [Entrophospora sp. SA101]CAJ0757922.1 9867_t:CDS:2 [Entrophospora sp. SA101]